MNQICGKLIGEVMDGFIPCFNQVQAYPYVVQNISSIHTWGVRAMLMRRAPKPGSWGIRRAKPMRRVPLELRLDTFGTRRPYGLGQQQCMFVTNVWHGHDCWHCQTAGAVVKHVHQ
jgi:hypothetical protein